MQMMNGATPIYIAAQSGQLGVLRLLVQKGGTIKINAYDGMSCLHAATQSGHLDCVKFLVSKSNTIHYTSGVYNYRRPGLPILKVGQAKVNVVLARWCWA